MSKRDKKIQLYNFIEKIPLHNKEKSVSNDIIKHIYDEISESYSYIKNIKGKHKVSVSEIYSNNIRSTSISFLPKEVKTIIYEFSNTEISYSISMFERKIDITFFIDENIHEFPIQIYNDYVNKMLMWFYILHQHSSSQCSKKIHIYLYFTRLEKRLPSSNIDIIDSIHVNTAFTTGCKPTTEIVIFRKEEWFKVFIHETFHCFGLDFSDMNNSKVNKQIHTIFPVSSEVNLYEAYTEFWATIINTCFLSFFITLKKKNMFMKIFEKLIDMERKYSFFQMVKTLDFMGLEYEDLYSSSEKSIIARRLYKERTNVLSYYILKTILLYNYQDFLSFNHPKNIFLFEKTEENQMRLISFIKNNYKSKDFLNNISYNRYGLGILKKKNKGQYEYIISNMRMTLFG